MSFPALGGMISIVHTMSVVGSTDLLHRRAASCDGYAGALSRSGRQVEAVLRPQRIRMRRNLMIHVVRRQSLAANEAEQHLGVDLLLRDSMGSEIDSK
jgi:hypothetical protein